MDIQKAGFMVLKEPTKTKLIERIARVCYKSEDKIGPGTDLKMVENLIKRRHFAMLEHADAIFEVSKAIYLEFDHIIKCWTGERKADAARTYPKSYLRMTAHGLDTTSPRFLVSGNFRAWYEFMEYVSTDYRNEDILYAVFENMFPVINQAVCGILTSLHPAFSNPVPSVCEDMREITDITELSDTERMVHERFSVLFTTDRGITHELVRMREASFAQESTRYVNYAINKYGAEIGLIEPYFFVGNGAAYKIWEDACRKAEDSYMALTNMGIPPQQARTVLPHSTKVDIVVTANLEEWKHMFELRACDMTGAAHPQMKEVMVPLLIAQKTVYPFAFGNLVPAKY